MTDDNHIPEDDAKAQEPSLPDFAALGALGWSPYFAQQVDIDALSQTPPARVTAVHRNGTSLRGQAQDYHIPYGSDALVGDWVLYDAVAPKNSVVLDRKSVIKRRAAGHDRQVQLIAANIDTAFIVTSCNRDFNVARLERYIALALEAEVTPVVVLTKTDLADDPDEFTDQARGISDMVEVIAMNALLDDPGKLLAPWCRSGQTVAFLGSSGVGKSTLTNALTGSASQETQTVRVGDSKGRHTTTHRELHFVAGGCAVLDTPGMRELQVTDAATGIETLFEDIQALALQCKFNDCAHDTEPGCAVRRAIQDGTLDQTRVERWQKLAAEDAHNSASLAQRRTFDRNLHKRIKAIQKHNKK